MFALIVLFQHKFVCADDGGIELFGDESHLGDLFDDRRIIDGIIPVFDESEHAVTLDENAGDFHGIQFVLTELLDDGKARILLVLSFDLCHAQ